MDVSARAAEVTWMGSRIEEFVLNREALSDVDAARVLAIIHDTGARDSAIYKLTRENASTFVDFWQDLVRRSPSEVRDTPATLLALSSYLSGDGAKAWTALDQLSEHDTLADLVAASIEPRVIAQTIQSANAAPTTGSAGLQQAALRNHATREPHRPEKRAPHFGAPGPDKSSPSR
jgi:hypothetical protein